MGEPNQIVLRLRAGHARAGATVGGGGGRPVHGPPHPSQPPVGALHRDVRPIDVLVHGRGEHHGQADGVGPPLLDERQGFDHVPSALGQGRPLVDHHPLVDERLERLHEADQPQIEQCLDDEPGVEQMEDGVLDPADVGVHGKPPLDRFLRPCLPVVVR